MWIILEFLYLLLVKIISHFFLCPLFFICWWFSLYGQIVLLKLLKIIFIKISCLVVYPKCRFIKIIAFVLRNLNCHRLNLVSLFIRFLMISFLKRFRLGCKVGYLLFCLIRLKALIHDLGLNWIEDFIINDWLSRKIKIINQNFILVHFMIAYF